MKKHTKPFKISPYACVCGWCHAVMADGLSAGAVQGQITGQAN